LTVGQIRGAVGERWIIGMVRYGIRGCPSEEARRQIFFAVILVYGTACMWGAERGLSGCTVSLSRMLCVDAR
jgi:hypothetical protein